MTQIPQRIGFTIIDRWYVKDNYAKRIGQLRGIDPVKADQLFRQCRIAYAPPEPPKRKHRATIETLTSPQARIEQYKHGQLGIAELSWVLMITREELIGALAEENDIPKPIRVGGLGPVWDKLTIAEWIKPKPQLSSDSDDLALD